MSDTPRTESQVWEPRWDGMGSMPEPVVGAEFARQLERELNSLRTDAARYRAVRGLYVGAGAKWSDTGVLFYSAACPPDEKYVRSDDFDQMADRLCEEPQ